MDTEILRLARSRRGPYLAALCAPAKHQDALWTLLALDAELARIPDLVSEPMLGRIRLQWWIDALGGAKGGHPVLAAVVPLDLDVQALQRLVELRGFDLEDGPATLAQHEAQARACGAALAGLMLDALGVTDQTVRAAAADVAGAWAALDAVMTARRIATPQDAEALRQFARTQVGRARTLVLEDKTQRKKALPVLVLARVVDERLASPHAPLGAGAVLRVWWGGLSGRF